MATAVAVRVAARGRCRFRHGRRWRARRRGGELASPSIVSATKNASASIRSSQLVLVHFAFLTRSDGGGRDDEAPAEVPAACSTRTTSSRAASSGLAMRARFVRADTCASSTARSGHAAGAGVLHAKGSGRRVLLGRCAPTDEEHSEAAAQRVSVGSASPGRCSACSAHLDCGHDQHAAVAAVALAADGRSGRLAEHGTPLGQWKS